MQYYTYIIFFTQKVTQYLYYVNAFLVSTPTWSDFDHCVFCVTIEYVRIEKKRSLNCDRNRTILFILLIIYIRQELN